MKQFGTPPFSTNSPISDQFFYDPLICLNFKNKNPPNSRGGDETMFGAFYVDSLVHLLVCLVCQETMAVKGYLCYKTITSQNVSSEAQIRNFFIS